MEQLQGEELRAVVDDLNEVLAKHGAEIQIESVLKFVKTNGETTDTKTEESSQSGVRKRSK